MIRIPGKIPITIHSFFWIIALIIGWITTHDPIGMVLWATVIFFSILVHEYGHALTAVAFGQRASIDLVGFGGLTRRGGKKIKLWQEFLIVLNGPLAGFLLYGISVFFQYRFSSILRHTGLDDILNISIEINLVWTVLNLLPVQPLDGGRIMSIILEAVLGFRGVKIALFVSIVFSLCLAFYAFMHNWLIGGILFVFFAVESFRAWHDNRGITDTDQNTILRDLFKDAEQDMARGLEAMALDKYSRILQKVHKGLLHTVATMRTAQIIAKQGRIREGLNMLLSVRKQLDPEGLYLLHQLAFTLNDWSTTVEVGKQVFEHYPTYQVALINATAYAEMQQDRQAIGWLKGAVREGLPDLQEAMNRPCFDRIRSCF